MHLQLAKLCCAVYTTEYILFLFFTERISKSRQGNLFGLFWERRFCWWKDSHINYLHCMFHIHRIYKSSSYLKRQRRLWAPGLEAIRPKVSFGSNKVNLFRRTLLTCSTSRAKCRVEPRPNLIWRLSITSCTVVEVSYLNDLVWPFSRKTLRTLGINGATESAPDNWLWP